MMEFNIGETRVGVGPIYKVLAMPEYKTSVKEM